MDPIKAFNEFQLKLMGRNQMVQNFNLILIPSREEVQLIRKQKNNNNINDIICYQKKN